MTCFNRVCTLLSSFLILLTSCMASAQSSSGAAVNPAKNPQDYSGEGIILESFHRHVRFENDGTGFVKTTASYKVQSDAGVQQLGILQFFFSSGTEDVTIVFVRVRKKDGTIINTPVESAQESPSSLSQTAPMYTDIRIKHLPVVGLRPGDTLEYESLAKTKNPLVPGQFFFEANFEKNIITKDELLELDIPASRKVKLKLERGLTSDAREENGRKLYSWRHSNLERKDPTKKPAETGDPEDSAPSVQLTTFDSWEEVGRWYWGLQSARTKFSPEMQKKAQELTSSSKTDAEKIRKIYDFVSKEFRYIGLEFGVGRYQPHEATEVYGSGYGDCKDKHTLFSAMLKSIGYDAAPVLINSTRKLDPDVPSPSQFDHLISAVRIGNDLVWLDTTPEIAPFGMLFAPLRKKKALAIFDSESSKIMETPADPPFATAQNVIVQGTVNDLGKLEATIQQISRGDLELILRQAFRKVPQAQWKQLAQNLSYATGWGGEVSDVTASDSTKNEEPFSFKYKYARENYVDWSQATGEMTVPLTSMQLPTPAEETAAKPKAIPLGAPGEFNYRATVELASGTSAFAPPNVSIGREFAEYRAAYKVQDRTFTVERKLVIKMREVPPSLEAEYQAFYRSVQEDEQKRVNVWRKAGGIAAVPANTTAQELSDAGKSALERRDFNTAAKVFQKLTELEPKHPTAWAGLGQANLGLMKMDLAVESFRKQMDVNPAHESAYGMLAAGLAAQGKFDEAITELKKYLEKNPTVFRARMTLGYMYIETGKFKEAIPYIEETLKEYPDDQSLQLKLAQAYLETGDAERALPSYERVLQSTPTPSMKNNIAYALAEKKIKLDKAEELAKSALNALEEHLQKVDLKNLTNDDLSQNNLQVAVWDTVGWVFKQQGKLKEAENYIHSAWITRQDREVADHLAEIYHLQGRLKEEEEIKNIAASLVRPPKNMAEAVERAKALNQDKDRPLLLRNPKGKPQQVTQTKETKVIPLGGGSTEALQEMRTIKLPRKLKQSASAELFVLFSPSKVEEVNIIKGGEDFESWTSTFKGLDYKMEFPSGSDGKIVRRAVVSCSSYSGECLLVMLPPETVMSVN